MSVASTQNNGLKFWRAQEKKNKLLIQVPFPEAEAVARQTSEGSPTKLHP